MHSKICLPHASAVGMFMQWYNHEHRHSAIRFVTPAQRHESIDVSLLEKRAVVYEAAKQQRPERWSGTNQNWQPVLVMYLNPDQHI
jgi:putative transposase